MTTVVVRIYILLMRTQKCLFLIKIYADIFGKIISPLFASILKFGYDFFSATKFTKYLGLLLPKNKLIKITSTIIPFPEVTDEIVTAIGDTDGGVWIIGAPGGSGKSTYLKVAIKQIEQKTTGSTILYYEGGSKLLVDYGLHKLLGINPLHMLSEHLSSGTIIILDQIDMSLGELTDKIKSYIIELATNGRNSKKINFILIVSVVEVYDAMLLLNGRDKIVPMFVSKERMKWDFDKMQAYVDGMLSMWTEEDRKVLAMLCVPSNSVGTVYNAVKLVSRYSNFGCIPATTMDIILNDVQTKGAAWRKFHDVNCNA